MERQPGSIKLLQISAVSCTIDSKVHSWMFSGAEHTSAPVVLAYITDSCAKLPNTYSSSK